MNTRFYESADVFFWYEKNHILWGGTNLYLYKYEDVSPSTGDFHPWIDISNPSLLGNVFLVAVRIPDRFSNSLDIDFWYVTFLLKSGHSRFTPDLRPESRQIRESPDLSRTVANEKSTSRESENGSVCLIASGKTLPNRLGFEKSIHERK